MQEKRSFSEGVLSIWGSVSVCLSVRPSVRPSVNNFFSRMLFILESHVLHGITSMHSVYFCVIAYGRVAARRRALTILWRTGKKVRNLRWKVRANQCGAIDRITRCFRRCYGDEDKDPADVAPCCSLGPACTSCFREK